MNKKEIFSMLRRNGHRGRQAIVFISDFLGTSMQRAREIYNTEYLPSISEEPDITDGRGKGGNRREITYNGETHSIAEWAEIAGITRDCLYTRLNALHWSFEKAITTKVTKVG